jgi:hypothetical protein
MAVAARRTVRLEEVAAGFDISPPSLHRWMRQAGFDDGMKDGQTSAEQAEIMQLYRVARGGERDPAPVAGLFRSGLAQGHQAHWVSMGRVAAGGDNAAWNRSTPS